MKEKRAKGLPMYPGSIKTYSLLTVLTIGEAIAIIAQAYFLARAITFLFDGKPFADVFQDVGLFLVAFIIRYLMTHLEMAVADQFAAKTARYLRDQLIKKYFQKGLAFVQKMGTGHLVTLAIEGIDHVKKYIEIIGIRMIKTAIVPMFIVIFVYFYDPISSVILVVTVPIVIIFMILLGMAAEKMADRQYETYTRLSNHFVDSLRGLETLMFLGKGRRHAKNISHVSDEYRKATMKTLRVAFLSTFALDFFTSLSIAFVAVGLGFRLIDGDILLLPALTILILAPEYFAPIKQVGKDYHATLDGQISMHQVNELLEDDQSKLKDELALTDQLLWTKQSELSFKNLSLKISETTLLDNISFTAKNEWIGIIGASGAGKSTLINILSGRLQPTDGEIRVNDQRLKSLHIDEWFEQISYIPQQPYIFPMSLAHNIRFYEPQATDQEIERIIEQIGLKTFVKSLPNGIHEKIGEGGRTLSGGQEQRIAIARALLSDKPIILLDEPTAHLDVETEYEIKQLMIKLFKDKLVFMATHRLHWLQNMDHILLLDNGQLIARGSHDELLERVDQYRQFLQEKRRTVI